MTTSYPVTTYVHASKTVTTSSTTMVAASSTRLALIIVNTGANTVYIRLDGGTAVADNSAFPLYPGDNISPHLMPGDIITGIVASGTGSLHIVTGG